MKTALTFSGGLDSTTLLFHLLSRGDEVYPLWFDYGQRHRKEREFAEEICKLRGLNLTTIDLSSSQSCLSGSALTSPDVKVPHGHYTDESMKVTVVPNRNMIFLSHALAFAISHQLDAVAYGAHAGDHSIYPDCRPEFVHAMQNVASLCDWRKCDIVAPFLEWTKTEIVTRGAELSVPFEKTWSCYEGNTFHCGQCGTCVERKEAFQLAKIDDPTIYSVDLKEFSNVDDRKRVSL